MKSVIQFLFLCMLIFAFACGGSTDTSSTSESEEHSKPSENTEQDTKTPEIDAPSGDAAYSINVIDASPKSPRKEMTGTIDGIDITINYGSPYVKERQILGGLIPYGEVWRTGANECTSIELSKDAIIEGKKLPAGKYGLFTFSTKGSCEVIFNSVHDQWGHYSYDAGKDVLRVTVQPKMVDDSAESMDFMIEGNTISCVWEKVRIPFEVKAG